MAKTVLNLLVAGTIGFVSIIAGYELLAVYGHWLPQRMSDATFIATLLMPIPIGAFIAWAAYRILDSI